MSQKPIETQRHTAEEMDASGWRSPRGGDVDEQAVTQLRSLGYLD